MIDKNTHAEDLETQQDNDVWDPQERALSVEAQQALYTAFKDDPYSFALGYIKILQKSNQLSNVMTAFFIDMILTAQAQSEIRTHILKEMKDVDINRENNQDPASYEVH